MINIIDDFYDGYYLNKIISLCHSSDFFPTYQPSIPNFPNRLKLYPCYETEELKELTNLFRDTFERKTNLRIKNIKTSFRKILTSELKDVFKYGLRPHKDHPQYDFAGVIYLNLWNLNDGTALYSFKEQIEPDIIIGSKPNRCVYYNSQIFHNPCQDPITDVRIIQPFFITCQKE
jgi:hypothetical protein